jgi:hypothetical protein
MMANIDARGFPRAGVGAREMFGGIGEAAKDWATTETGATVIGVAAGISVGEWVGNWINEYFAVTNGWNKVLYKAAGKALVSFVAFYLGRRMGGLGHVLLNGVAAGSLASIVGDVVGQYTAPALAGRGGNILGGRNITVNPGRTNISQSNRNVGALGKTNAIITSI